MYDNDFNNNGFNTDFLVAGELQKQNNLKQQELKEKEAMRKAYCIANNVPYEEIVYNNQSPKFGQGLLKVFVCIIWLFIVGVLLSVLLTDGNFKDFIGWWF